MASPQLENGYARIANEILEALAKYGLPKQEIQIVMVIFRHTYGYGKKTAYIKHKTFKDQTLMDKFQISRARKNLINRNIVIVDKNCNGLGLIYRFNKNYHTWQSLTKTTTLKKSTTSMKIVDKNYNTKGVVPLDKRNKDKESKKENFNFILPDWIDPELWKQFLDHRKKLRKPATAYSQHLLIKKLEKIKEAGFDPEDTINISIERGWQGFFQPQGSEDSWKQNFLK